MDGLTFQRICAWSGMVAVTCFFGAFALAGFIPPLKPHSSAAVIAEHYQTHTTGIRIGGVVMLLSGMFYAAFVAVVSEQMRRIPGLHRIAPTTQSIAGAFGCVTFLIPAMFLEVAAFRPDRDIGDTQMLNDFFWIFLVMPWTPFLTQNWAFAYAILRDDRERPLFPRWLAYVNLWCPIIFSPSILLPFFKSGPFSWAGIFVVWIPAVVFILQFVVNVRCLLAAINDEAHEGAPEPLATTTSVAQLG